MPNFQIDPSYKEVAERLRDLFAKHPEASLRGNYEFHDGYVIYRAECYRHPEDPAPAVGTAWEEVPGKTPYTRGSELQNAETSAWGRAIVAAGASESKRIASADDIRLANDRRTAPKKSTRESNESTTESNAGDVSSSPAPSKSKAQTLKARAAALVAAGVDVGALREAWQLPAIDKADEKQIGLWEELLREADASLAAPFAGAAS